MVSKWTLLFCALLVSQSLATREVLDSSAKSSNRVQLSGTEDTKATASATGSASVKGPGSVEVIAEATGEAFTEVSNAVAVLVAEAVAKAGKGGEATAIAEGTVEAFGKAIAEAYADTFVSIVSTSSNGEGCASAFADASATATAFARAVIDVLAKASNKISFADASGAAEAISVVTVNAFAQADAQACGQGVFTAEVISTSFGKAVAQPYAVVFASAFAAVASETAVSSIVLTADSGVLEASYSDGSTVGDITGQVDASGGGTSGASTTALPACSAFSVFISRCCKSRDKPCRCGRGCQMERFTLEDPNIVAIKLTKKRSLFPTDLNVGDACLC